MKNEKKYDFRGGGGCLLLAVLMLVAGCPKDSALPEIPEFVELKAGSFQMGCSAGDDYQKPVHTVTLSRTVEICVHEVTQAEYEAYCTYGDAAPAAVTGDGKDLPVYNVSWYDALVYCNKRSIVEGLNPCYSINGSTVPSNWGAVPSSGSSATKSAWDAVVCDFSANGYRLPSEAEWEYAARAGNTTTDAPVYSGTGSASDLGTYAWYSVNAGNKVQKVKSKTSNSNKLYDMSGNVAEWCWDSWFGYTSSNATNPTGGSGSSHIIRGGSAYDDASACTVTCRNNADAFTRDKATGFRVVRTKGGSSGSSGSGFGGTSGSGNSGSSGGNGQTTYTVFHYQQKVTGGSSYDCYETEFDKSISGTPTLENSKKDYAGFTATKITSSNGNISVFYNRNTITYTFQTGTGGTFSDGTTSKTVTGLYGESYTVPKAVPVFTSGISYKYCGGWGVADSVESLPETLGPQSQTYRAQWLDVPTDFVLIDASSIENGHGNFLICDHELTRVEFSYPETVSSPNNPCSINWYESIKYCNKRSSRDGLTPCYSINGITDPDCWSNYPNSVMETVACDFSADGWRLPTTNEWVFAAKGGENYIYSGSNSSAEVGHFVRSPSVTDVKTKKKNGFNLYDMSGNAFEWCWEQSSAYDVSKDASEHYALGGNYGGGGGQVDHPYLYYYGSNIANKIIDVNATQTALITFGLRVVRTCTDY